MVQFAARLGATAVLLAFDISLVSAQLTFSITNQGGATPQMVAAFTDAAALWSARLNDPIAINVRIDATVLPGGVTGFTTDFFDPYSYANVRSAYVADRRSLDDLSSVASLQAGPAFSMLINRTANNPNGVVNGTPYFDTGLGGPGQSGPENNTTIRIASANAKALGLFPGNATGLDGTITFSSQISFDYDRNDGITAGQIDFVGLAAHELGHLLGFRSGIGDLGSNGSAPGLNDNQLTFVTALDLFRFSTRSISAGGGVGIIDWTADNTAKYFSVDGGATQIATFSNGAKFGDGFEAHHWKNNLGLGIMNPTVHAGELLTISDTDLRAFDALGYDVNLPGDFNASGTTDAADYVAWRKVDGTPAGYQLWRNNFAQPGNGAGANPNITVPEPTALVLLMLTAACVAVRMLVCTTSIKIRQRVRLAYNPATIDAVSLRVSGVMRVESLRFCCPKSLFRQLMTTIALLRSNIGKIAANRFQGIAFIINFGHRTKTHSSKNRQGWAPAVKSMLEEESPHDSWERKPSPIDSSPESYPEYQSTGGMCLERSFDVPFFIKLGQSMLNSRRTGVF
jgi:hypothetical protein